MLLAFADLNDWCLCFACVSCLLREGRIRLENQLLRFGERTYFCRFRKKLSVALISMMERKRTKAIENSACCCKPDEYDISLATAVVRNLTLWKSDGMFGALPETIMTAIASPIARPTPSTTEAAIPLLAAGTETLK